MRAKVEMCVGDSLSLFLGGGGGCQFSVNKKRGACKPYNWLLKTI